jgi:hypothetical protein
MRSSKKSLILVTVALGLLVCQFGPSEIASAMRPENSNKQNTQRDASEWDEQRSISEAIPEPALSTGERLRLAFPYKPSGIKEFLTRNVANDVPEWPEMYYLNEDVDHNGVTLRIVDYRLIRGKEIPTVMYPKPNEFHDAPNGISYYQFGEPTTFIAIPSQTTMLMVKFEVEPEF